MGKTTISIKKKQEILAYLRCCNCVKATAKHFSNRVSTIKPSQIRMWKMEEQFLAEKEKSNPKAVSFHSWKTFQNQNLEQKMYNWFFQQRQAALAVSSASFVVYVLSRQPGFKEGSPEKLTHFFYPFLSMWNLSCRIAKRMGQKLNGHLLNVRKSFAESFLIKFSSIRFFQNALPQMIVNKDQTAIFFNQTKRGPYILKEKTRYS